MTTHAEMAERQQQVVAAMRRRAAATVNAIDAEAGRAVFRPRRS